ncbi:MAG: hypothetical protein P8J33_04480 [Pirellulaceae bacterium]|nr:hypothetical protein [Pirellulaceae bacterium]
MHSKVLNFFCVVTFLALVSSNSHLYSQTFDPIPAVEEDWGKVVMGALPDSSVGRAGVTTWTLGPRLLPLILRPASSQHAATHIASFNQARPWGVALHRKGHTLDLSGPGASITWVGKVNGDREVHAIIMSPQDLWYVSKNPIKFSEQWALHSTSFSKMKWQRYNVITGVPMSGDTQPDMKKVIQVGIADLKGDSSEERSVWLDSISVFGQARKLPTKPASKKSSPSAEKTKTKR